MKVFYGICSAAEIKKKTAVTLGVFDGVHRGHKKVIKSLLQVSKKEGLKSLVVTFEPHPENLWGKNPPPYINALSERLDLIGVLGVDYCLVIRFSRKFALLKPEVFVLNVLMQKLNMAALVVSKNYKFGYNAQGNLRLLTRLAGAYGFKLRTISPLKRNGCVINSTCIRRLLAQKKISEAAKLLGRPYFIEGRRCCGRQIGRRIGFPTVNIIEPENILIPAGVYAAFVETGRRRYKAVANIGFRPTLRQKKSRRSIEVHLLNFRGSLRHKNVKVYFVKRLRSEKCFKNTAFLKKRIALDVKKAKSMLSAPSAKI